MEIGINDARPILGDLITKVWQGEDVIITRNGKPAAMLTKPYERTWTLDVDTTQGALEAVVADVLHLADGVHSGAFYQSAYSMGGTNNMPPTALLELKRELEARGYNTAL